MCGKSRRSSLGVWRVERRLYIRMDEGKKYFYFLKIAQKVFNVPVCVNLLSIACLLCVLLVLESTDLDLGTR